MAKRRKKKAIKIEFYEVTMPEGADAFEDILAAISAMPNNERRTKDIGGGRHVRLRRISQRDDRWYGDITRIRMTEMPGKAGLDGSFEQLDFGDDEGLGEQSAFLYHPTTQVLVIQYNYYGATPPLFARYIEAMGNVEGVIELKPAIHPDVLDRVANMVEYRTLEVALAGIHNAGDLGQQGRSLSGLVDVINQFRAPSARITISMGREEGSLPKEVLLRTIRWLFGASASRVKAVKISGNDGEHSRIIDLIEDRLVETVKIQLDEHRGLPYNDRRDAVYDAWNKHISGLARMFAEE